MVELDKFEEFLLEHDGVDPLTLTNMILDHSMLKIGYNWVKQIGPIYRTTAREIFANAPKEVDNVGEFKLEEAKKKKKPAKKKKKISSSRKIKRKKSSPKEEAPQQQEAPVSKEERNAESQEVSQEASAKGIETNTTDPRIQSTDPSFINCPAFLNGICRIDGRPCAFSNIDYRDCGKYHLATSGLPDLMEIPFGREDELEYKIGIKS